MSEYDQDLVSTDSSDEAGSTYVPRHARPGMPDEHESDVEVRPPRHAGHTKPNNEAAPETPASSVSPQPVEPHIFDTHELEFGESAPNTSGEPSDFAHLDQNVMTPVATERAETNKRWQDVRPKTPRGKRELRHTRGWYQAVIVCLVMIVAVGIVAGGVTYYLELWGGKTVPSVVGLTSAAANDRLSQKGFAVQVNYVPSDNGNDRVTSVDPGAGTRIDDGSTVTLTVGQSRVLPAVVGMTSADARQALADAGATNVRLVYQRSTEEEGTVLSVSPSEGSSFVSSDQITLTIAQLPKVPDVVGRTVTDALKVLSDAGLTPTLEFVRSGQHPQGYVESTSPAAGKRSDEKGSVHVTVVGSEPSDEYDLAGYLSALPQALSDFLTTSGYSLSVGYTDSSGSAVEQLTNANGNSLVVSATPWTRNVAQPSSSNASDVLDSISSMNGLGVSLGIAAAQCPQGGANVSTCEQVMQLCGLGGTALDACDESSIRLSEDAESVSTDFYSAYGEQGDYGWGVVLYTDSAGSTQAIVIYAPKASFDALDLSQTGNSMASYLAWATLMN